MLPSANADAPTSLSSVLLLGLHRIGESTDEVDQPRLRDGGYRRRAEGKR